MVGRRPRSRAFPDRCCRAGGGSVRPSLPRRSGARRASRSRKACPSIRSISACRCVARARAAAAWLAIAASRSSQRRGDCRATATCVAATATTRTAAKREIPVAERVATTAALRRIGSRLTPSGVPSLRRQVDAGERARASGPSAATARSSAARGTRPPVRHRAGRRRRGAPSTRASKATVIDGERRLPVDLETDHVAQAFGRRRRQRQPAAQAGAAGNSSQRGRSAMRAGSTVASGSRRDELVVRASARHGAEVAHLVALLQAQLHGIACSCSSRRPRSKPSTRRTRIGSQAASCAPTSAGSRPRPAPAARRCDAGCPAPSPGWRVSGPASLLAVHRGDAPSSQRNGV